MNRSVLTAVRLTMRGVFLVGTMALVACSSKPRVPDWQMNVQSASQKAVEANLSGNARLEALEWDRARAEVARTGQIDLLARLELLRCAAQTASLVVAPCDRFERLRPDATPADRAYADYLAGRLQPAQVPLLPEAQRKVAMSGDIGTLSTLEDPLSRLVAAAVLFRTGRATPAVIGDAIDTASEQGWRRPLLAWLGLQIQRAEAGGDTQAGAMLRRRAALVEQGGIPR